MNEHIYFELNPTCTAGFSWNREMMIAWRDCSKYQWFALGSAPRTVMGHWDVTRVFPGAALFALVLTSIKKTPWKNCPFNGAAAASLVARVMGLDNCNKKRLLLPSYSEGFKAKEKHISRRKTQSASAYTNDVNRPAFVFCTLLFFACWRSERSWVRVFFSRSYLMCAERCEDLAVWRTSEASTALNNLVSFFGCCTIFVQSFEGDFHIRRCYGM